MLYCVQLMAALTFTSSNEEGGTVHDSTAALYEAS
jgi:hypothetical protein